MPSSLRYLIVVRPNGVPAYSQSFDFESVFACRTFHNRLSDLGQKSDILGGYFQVIKDIVSEVVSDKLKMIDLAFLSYQLLGIVEDGYLFIGIFEDRYSEEGNGVLLNLMSKIANRFMSKYYQILSEEIILDNSRFANFTTELLDLGVPLSLQRCRDCLINCAEEHQGCLPHLIYFQENLEKSYS